MNLKPAHEHQDASGAEQPVSESKSIDEIVGEIKKNLENADVNRDGNISRDELRQSVESYKEGEIYHESANAKKIDNIIAIIDTLPKDLKFSIQDELSNIASNLKVFDLNKDGRISLDEFEESSHNLQTRYGLNESAGQAPGK